MPAESPVNDGGSGTGSFVLTGRFGSNDRTYNNRQQLTNLTANYPLNLANEQVNLAYSYPATQNNGQISSMTDAISGETVSLKLRPGARRGLAESLTLVLAPPSAPRSMNERPGIRTEGVSS
ncbi:MAG: hypothetical protein FJW26_19835 [Acidimicrobiia bacterium]|nr:hypothetical protein [Acidimicrobiia bacterium]